jgi:glycosyltransferase involved in cell wall biosynthesis/GT2 family glycosyltransferase
VCLATPEIAGPIFTGGVGRFYASLADSLVRSGHGVTIAYGLGEHSERGTIREWVEHYAQRQIGFVPVPEVSPPLDAPFPRQRAYRMYRWLRAHEDEFDIVHFPEWQGVGFYALNAKRQGLAFAETTFIVISHSPTMLLAPSHLLPVDHPNYLEFDFLERGSVEAADYLVSPSAFLHAWMQEEEWRLPERAFVHPLILPRSHRRTGDERSTSAGPTRERQSVRELVFFGRLDVLKGLDTFCAALDRLVDSDLQPESVAFLGRESVIEGLSSRTYLEQRAVAWPFPCVVHTDLDTAKALAYLRGRGRLAVTASRVENSPNAVYECLGSQIPFVVSAVGGVPELIAESDREQVLFPPRPDELAALLRETLEHGAVVARPAIDFDDAEERWIGLHERIVDDPEPKRGRNGRTPAKDVLPAERPLVSVCLSHFNRPRLLRQALTSLEAQDYPNFEVVLVDDASTHPGAVAFLDGLEADFDRRGWRIVRHDQNRYLGAVRNTAARHARGELLVFMDDDDCAKPGQISTLVQVAEETGADIVTSAGDVFSHHDPPADDDTPVARELPLGAALGVGLYGNCFGSANALVRRSAFDRLGGFTEDWGVAFEDWELFANAAFAGLKQEVVAEPLFWHRRLPGGMADTTNRTANLQRALRAYLAHSSPELHGLLRIGQATIASQLPDGVTAATSVPGFDRFELYWNSTSWRVTRPLRQLKRRRQGLPLETKPMPQTEAEIDSLITGITTSLSWKLTAPVRVLGRFRHSVRAMIRRVVS